MKRPTFHVANVCRRGIYPKCGWSGPPPPCPKRIDANDHHAFFAVSSPASLVAMVTHRGCSFGLTVTCGKYSSLQRFRQFGEFFSTNFYCYIRVFIGRSYKFVCNHTYDFFKCFNPLAIVLFS